MLRTCQAAAAATLAVLLLAAPAAADEDPIAVGAEVGTPTAGVPLSASFGPQAAPPRGPRPDGDNAPVAAPADDPYEYRTIFVPGPCPTRPDGALPRLIAEQRRLPPNGAWETIRSYCDGDRPAPVVDLDDIRGTAVTVLAQVSPPRPALTVQPQAGSLVNQPAIFLVDDPGPPPADSALNPLSQRTVTVRLAEPTYSWSFGDGSGRDVGERRGRAYSRGDAVPREGAGDPYVTHTYADEGGVTVTVTATYAVSYTFSGDPRVFTLPPLQIAQSADLRVRPAQSGLVAR